MRPATRWACRACRSGRNSGVAAGAAAGRSQILNLLAVIVQSPELPASAYAGGPDQ